MSSATGSEEKVLRLVLSEFPTPIANPARWLLPGVHRGDPLRHLLNGVLDTYEAAVHFLALVQLRDYVESGAEDATYNTQLLEKFKTDLTLGRWAEMVRELTRRLCKVSEVAVPDLGRMFGESGWKPELAPLDDLVAARNKSPRGHPDTFLRERDIAALVERHRPVLIGLLESLAFLRDIDLIGVVSWDGPGSSRIRDAFVFCGKDPDTFYRPAFGVEVTIPIEPAEREGLLLLRNRTASGRRWLKLGPVGLFLHNLRTEKTEAYFLDALDLKAGRLRKATFRSYTAGVPPVDRPFAEEGDTWLRATGHWLNEALHLPSEQTLTVERSASDPRSSRILAAKQVGFVGRETLLSSVEAALDARRKVVHLKGPRGQGKSAVAARLVQRAVDRGRVVLFYFFSQPEGTFNAEGALAHLLSKAFEARLVTSPTVPGAGTEELVTRLVEVITRPAAGTAKGGPLIVLDGLDEAEDPGGLLQSLWSAVESTVPASGASILTAGREVSPVPAATTIEVGGLDDEEVREVLQRRGVAADLDFARRVRTSVEGNPLFLLRIAEALAASPGVTELPTTVADWQREELEKLDASARCRSCGTAFRSLVALLAVALEPLTPATLKELARAAEGETYQALRLLDPLMSGTTRVTFFHHSLREAARAMVSPEELAAAHRALARQCTLDPGGDYARHEIEHLIGAGSFDEAVGSLVARTPGDESSLELLQFLLSDGRAIFVAGGSDPGRVPGLCRATHRLIEGLAAHHRAVDPEGFAKRGDVKALLETAELKTGSPRRLLYLGAHFTALARSSESGASASKLEAELGSLGVNRVATEYRRLLRPEASGRVEPGKVQVERRPGLALAAARSGDLQAARILIDSFVGQVKRPVEAAAAKRCLRTLAIVGTATGKQLDALRPAGGEDEECAALLAFLEGRSEDARTAYRLLPLPTKPGDLRDRALLARLLGDEAGRRDLLFRLKEADTALFLQALCASGGAAEPSPEDVEALAEAGAGDELDALKVLAELAGAKRHAAAGVVAARLGAGSNAEAAGLLNWGEQAVEMLCCTDPERAAPLVGKIALADRRAMSLALGAAVVPDGREDVATQFLDEARALCREGDRSETRWLRVLEVIAYASGGADADVDLFFQGAGPCADSNKALALARSLAIRLARAGRLEAAERVAEEIGAAFGSRGRHRYRTVASWVAFEAAKRGELKRVRRLEQRIEESEGGARPGKGPLPSEQSARLLGQLAHASFLGGRVEEAAQEFARAVHVARGVGKGLEPSVRAHRVASALHSIARDEWRSGLVVEARAHAEEAWRTVSAVDSEDYALAEMAGTIAFVVGAHDAEVMAAGLKNPKRRSQALGFVARALVTSVVEREDLDDESRGTALRRAGELIASITAPDARAETAREILCRMIPREQSYMFPDPVRESRLALLEFLFAKSDALGAGLVTSMLANPVISHLALQVRIRMLDRPEDVGLLEEVVGTFVEASTK